MCNLKALYKYKNKYLDYTQDSQSTEVFFAPEHCSLFPCSEPTLRSEGGFVHWKTITGWNSKMLSHLKKIKIAFHLSMLCLDTT